MKCKVEFLPGFWANYEAISLLNSTIQLLHIPLMLNLTALLKLYGNFRIFLPHIQRKTKPARNTAASLLRIILHFT